MINTVQELGQIFQEVEAKKMFTSWTFFEAQQYHFEYNRIFTFIITYYNITVIKSFRFFVLSARTNQMNKKVIP